MRSPVPYRRQPHVLQPNGFAGALMRTFGHSEAEATAIQREKSRRGARRRAAKYALRGIPRGQKFGR